LTRPARSLNIAESIVIKLDIGSLPEGHSHQEIEEDASDLDLAVEGGSLSSQVNASLDVTRTGDEIYVTGRARVGALLDCARCLEPYSCVLEGPVQVMVMIGERAGGEEDDHLARLPVGARYIDLTDEIRSELLLRLPLKPLCSDACKGLCPVCGINLNRDKCSCRVERSDQRWDALKDLKRDSE
jgi:uncharacterized protein